MTLEELQKIPLTYTGGIRYTKGAHRMYRNEEFGIQKEVVTKFYEKRQEWGKGRASYFLDGDKREFNTIEDLLNAINERTELNERASRENQETQG